MALCNAGRMRVMDRILNPLLVSGASPVLDFLCPALLRSTCSFALQPRPVKTPQVRGLHCQSQRLRSISEQVVESDKSVGRIHEHPLPTQCAGCGALAQTGQNDEPGFYTLSRRAVKEWLKGQSSSERKTTEDRTVEESLLGLDDEIRKSFDVQTERTNDETISPPVCDRCHKLLHHQAGASIYHPSIQAIQDTIFETPHKYNHIYHVIDAADFPMSLIPGIHRLLQTTPQRSQNRRAKTERFYHGKKTEVSFIITRSDLLAPVKKQVDSMMPYLVEVLRDALGSSGKEVRLGNVRCVSAKRSWWTKELKEDVWNRGGGGWMVGKVNVGKSQLFESIFPKGRRGLLKIDPPLSVGRPAESNDNFKADGSRHAMTGEATSDPQHVAHTLLDTNLLSSDGLLPPAQIETDYPAMPLVSSLPGTTASPIRIPFGNGRGELVDLPGLSRGDLELHVQEEHRPMLVMKSRAHPEQQVIKPGQSLLLGGFIRITPTTPDLVVMAYSFTPIVSHLTSTEKAIGIQMRERETTVQNIAGPEVSSKIKSAGRFRLQWDVTKKRSGPMTARDAVGLKPERLAYQVFSADILIEGCGWVELVAQVRRRNTDFGTSSPEAAPHRADTSEQAVVGPEVEVFSPLGKFISIRRPMGAWLLNSKPMSMGQRGRPRRSMKGDKKNTKVRARAGF